VQPQGINMAPILQALARRQQGIPAPASQQQMSAPSQSQATPSDLPTQVQQGGPQQQATATGATSAGQAAQGPQFDAETRDLAKSLVQRLIKGI
jgi:hypothetical protein